MMGGVDLPVSIPLDRWDVERLEASAEAVQSNMLRFAALLPGVSDFDSKAFRLAHAEAVAMDPQSRILLEQVHAAFYVGSLEPANRAGLVTTLD